MNDDCKYLFAEQNKTLIVKLVGKITYENCVSFKKFTDKVLYDCFYKSIIVDLTETDHIDSTNLGIVAKLGIYALETSKQKSLLLTKDNNIAQIVYGTGFKDLFKIIESDQSTRSDLKRIRITRN